MEIRIRRVLTQIEDTYEEGVTRVETPQRKAAIIFVIENPMAGTKGADLTAMIEASRDMGRIFGEKIREVMGDREVQGYGKGGLVGLNGEAEHANAMLTTVFANPIREALGCGEAWISSFQKLAVPGEKIDIPMNHVDDVYVRSHYDGMTVSVPRSPQADELVLIFCVSTGKRLNARVGGLTHEDVTARRQAARA
ncbi:amino acid synthesis family protein [Ruixingdingia sedimenti]|uniref:Amino acid synthesis family protein n=1 Tax=Ruixingdingia sedimenti TaxID=3073604 RepID=A0ABU1F984_9RHOB|nr:amino acid synthesis family protein [Xinfangfangia sp. LG-4]MDR5653407.1 amino acid synthesis family protein [Xinfangfangia sp. LG-4]